MPTRLSWKRRCSPIFNSSDADPPIVAPVSKEGFAIKRTAVNAVSKGKDISGKFYGGAMPASPGDMTGKEVVLHMISKIAPANKGFDPETG